MDSQAVARQVAGETVAPEYIASQHKAAEPAAPVVAAVRRFSLKSLYYCQTGEYYMAL